MMQVYPRLRAYFSKEVWWHQSARLDYQYFIVVSILKGVVIVPLLLGANEVALGVLKLLNSILGYVQALNLSKQNVVILYTISLFVIGDLSRYWLHRWLHTVPLLWRFHRVHHSAEVLNPLTFYRVHPIENFLFGIRYALSAGIVTGVFIYLFGAKVTTIEFLGSNIFVYVFGILGANLRHSHIPLRYGMLEYFFISPYMHQLHHTKEYSDKNFGGVLALWDSLFKSRHVEKTAEHLAFGLTEKNPYKTVWSMLYEPFNRLNFRVNERFYSIKDKRK